MRLLLVDDNQNLCALLADGLSKKQFGVDAVHCVEDCRAALATTTYSVVILDLGLPDGDGFSVLEFVRDKSLSTPVLVLSARDAVRDRVRALGLGAADYLVKPFAFEELTARLRALLRRPDTYIGERLQLGGLVFDTGAAEINVEDRRLPLSRREASILMALLRRAGQVVSKEILVDRLFADLEDANANALEASVHRLRRRLAEANASVEIHTIRGVGYLIKETPTNPLACRGASPT